MRLLNGSNQQIPYVLERRNEPLSIDLPIRPASNVQSQELTSQPGSRQRSVYVVTLPYSNLPASTLVVETSARVFQRTVRIGIDRPPDRNRREPYFDVRSGETWRHADEHTPARPLPLRVETMPETEILVVVDEGDNAPLPLTKARLLLPSYRLRFFHAGQSLPRLAYGRDDLQPPQYDLALLAPRVMGAMATGDQCGTGRDCHTIVSRVFRIPEDILGRADRSRARSPGAHRAVDSGAGGAVGELTGD